MIAEYERAQILERSRRGKRHRAQLGEVSVMSNAPYGYRYLRKTDEAPAAYIIDEAEARPLLESALASLPRGSFSLRRGGREQKICHLERTLRVALVACFQLDDFPTGSMSFLSKRLKQRPRRVVLGHTGHKSGWALGLVIRRKAKRFFKAAQSKIAQPGTHE